jgi:molybdopterin converting factor small subunit
VTSSYPLNLPTDYYLKYIQSTLPQKDAGKWFIRPHHLETLTEHP